MRYFLKTADMPKYVAGIKSSFLVSVKGIGIEQLYIMSFKILLLCLCCAYAGLIPMQCEMNFMVKESRNLRLHVMRSSKGVSLPRLFVAYLISSPE